MLKRLETDATVYVKNENKFKQMLHSNRILKSPELLAKVEPVKMSVSNSVPPVKQYNITTTDDFLNALTEETRDDTSAAQGKAKTGTEFQLCL